MIPSLKDAPLCEKTVFLRLDLNVPMRDGVITDTTRITRSLPTIRFLLSAQTKIVIGSHLGRPNGQHDSSLSLRPVANVLQNLLGSKVEHIAQTHGRGVEQRVAKMLPGDILMLENLRFATGEEKNDAQFAQSLSQLADIYVNDSFSCSHRAHASVHALAQLLPSYGGLNLIEEITALQTIVANNTPPVAALIGGAKVSTKLNVLTNLASKVDFLIPAGGMANTFLLADGRNIGTSLCEPDMLKVVADIQTAASKNGCKLVLPIDVCVASAIDKAHSARQCSLDEIAANEMILDIGEQSIAMLQSLLATLRVLLWNGPLGVFEVPPFDNGTNKIANRAQKLTREKKLTTIVGGGDTISALNHASALDDMSYVSTAGGAFLEWLEGKTLPGIAVLTK